MELTNEKLQVLLEQAANKGAELALEKVYLDNRNAGYEEPSNEEDSEMASSYRKTYTYLNESGQECKIRLCGSSSADTDLQFQQLCLAKSNRNSSIKPSPKQVMTFRDFVENDYRESHLNNLALSTQGKNNYYLSHYIYPYLGDLPLAEINVNTIIGFRSHLSNGTKNGFKKDMSEKTIEDMTGFLNKIFKVAVALRRTDDNPVKRELLRKVGQPSGHHKAVDPKTLDRCKRMIPTIDDETVRLYAALLFYNGGGMRPEEILGLRWEDCDLNERMAIIHRAVTYVGRSRAVDIKATKTESSTRHVVLPQVLVDILRPLQQQSGYILHGRDPESPMCGSTWQRTYRKMQEVLGIKGQYSNYDLRTTFATQTIEAGASALAVAQMMGHKDTRMVETVYARRRKEGFESRRALIEMLNSTGGEKGGFSVPIGTSVEPVASL